LGSQISIIRKQGHEKAPVRLRGPSIEKERSTFLFLYLK
jgi:hypothetical protein